MNYDNPTPVAVCLVEVSGEPSPRLLGIVRGIEPGRGLLALPGGYVDQGESIEDALQREAREEVGLDTKAEDWRLVASRITAQNRVLIFGFLKHAISAQWVRERAVPCPREVLEVVVLSTEDPLVFPLHQEMAQKFFDGALFA